MQRNHQLRPFGGGPITLSWTVHWEADRPEVWPYFADTDRWNRVLGIDVRYTQSPQPGGTVKVLGHTVMGGQPAVFQETTFDFVHQRRFTIERTFETGPFTRYDVSLELEDAPEGGTTSTYTLQFTPRRGFEQPFAAAALRLDLAPKIEAAYQQVADLLAGKGGFFEPPPPPLSKDAQRRVRQTLKGVDDREAAKKLTRFLMKAPEFDQDRMLPRLLARRWKLPLERVVDVLLHGVHEGLLDLRWELLCPSCTGPQGVLESLDPDNLQAHCSSCNIAYTASFADSVAVTFRPVPELRRLDLPARCVGSPLKTPHVLTRQTAMAQAETLWHVDLPPGGYVLRELGSLTGTHIEVRAGGDGGEPVLLLRRSGALAPERIRRAPGPQTLRIISRMDRPARLVLERRWRPPASLTAAELLQRPKARALLPDSTLPPAVGAQVRPSAFLVAELFDAGATRESVRALLMARSPQRLCPTARGLVATWPAIEDAIAAAEVLQGSWQVCTTVGYGPLVTVGEHGAPGGAVVADAEAALRSTLPGRTGLPQEQTGSASVQAALAAHDVAVEDALSFDGRRDQLLRFPGEPVPALPATTRPPAAAGLTGRVLDGRYRLGEALGQGTFGVIYGAEGPEGPAVVKVLKGAFVARPEEVEAFFREARAGAQVEHPGVVRFLDFGHGEEGHLYLVMERLDGETLQERIERRLLTPHQACVVGAAASRGLHALHVAGLVHRDIKPENLFVGDDLQRDTKVLDLGIAADAEQIAEAIANEEARGTLYYMAPEQLKGDDQDGRVDLYALGLTLLVCLVGDLPYPELQGMPRAVARVTQGVPPVGRTWPHVPGALADVLDRCLANDPDARWADGRQLASMLDAVAGSLG